MKNIEEKTEAQHSWKPMEEYQPDRDDEENMMDIGEGDMTDVIKKMKVNQYIILHKGGKVETYFSAIDKLRKRGLDVGKGDCQYGWKMPIIEETRELRIFRRH